MPRSPLAVLPLRQALHSRQSKEDGAEFEKPSRRRQVTFDPEGMQGMVKWLIVALLRAGKHEARPTARRMTRFKETLDLQSASAWDKFYLTRFGVKFDRSEYTPLNTLITDPKWYDPETEPTRNFVERMPYSNVADSRLSSCFGSVG